MQASATMTMGGSGSALFAALQDCESGAWAHSPIYRWMVDNYAVMARAITGKNVRWEKLSAAAVSDGLTTRDGRDPSGETLRRTWYRVRKAIAALQEKREQAEAAAEARRAARAAERAQEAAEDARRRKAFEEATRAAEWQRERSARIARESAEIQAAARKREAARLAEPAPVSAEVVRPDGLIDVGNGLVRLDLPYPAFLTRRYGAV